MDNASMPPDSIDRTQQFVRLFSANSRRVYTYILTLIPNRVDAEEVFQEVSTVLWDKFDSWEAGTSFGAWACRIAYYKVLKLREKQNRAATPFSQLFVDEVDAELMALDDTLDAEYRALAECVGKLPAEDRMLIERRYQADGSPREIAESIRWPIQRVYKSLTRIRRVLLICVTKSLAREGA